MKKNTTFFNRIEQIIDYKGIKSVNEFALNYLKYDAPQKINRLKDPNKKPSYDIILNIVNKFEDISADWLITGNPPMLKFNKNNDKPFNIIEINPNGTFNTMVADVKASAGFGIIQDNPKKIEELPAMSLPNAPFGLNVAFQIDGDSMYPTVRHMDFVAGNRVYDLNDMRDGFVYVVVHKSYGALCKRVYRQGADWQIVSDNPNYRPETVTNDDILGFYKAFCRFSTDFRNYHDDLRKDVRELKSDVAQLKRQLEAVPYPKRDESYTVSKVAESENKYK